MNTVCAGRYSIRFNNLVLCLFVAVCVKMRFLFYIWMFELVYSRHTRPQLALHAHEQHTAALCMVAALSDRQRARVSRRREMQQKLDAAASGQQSQQPQQQVTSGSGYAADVSSQQSIVISAFRC